MPVVRLVALDVESTITGEKRKTGVFQNARTSTSATVRVLLTVDKQS